MELVAHISQKEVYSGRKVLIMRLIRYLQIGYLLHGITIVSLALTILFAKMSLFQISPETDPFRLALYLFLTLYFLSLIFFSQLDARSRYQNYKLVKDKLFEYGFKIRLLKPFVYSRCQRDAISVAANELQYHTEWKQLILHLGFKWYHVLPHLVVREPRILFTREYWDKTLLVKTYHSKYFLW